MKKIYKNKKGFTLIELIIVIVILAILAAIAIPAVSKYVGNANMARVEADINTIRRCMEMTMIEMGGLGLDQVTVPYDKNHDGTSAGLTPEQKELLKKVANTMSSLLDNDLKDKYKVIYLLPKDGSESNLLIYYRTKPNTSTDSNLFEYMYDSTTNKINAI